MNNELTVDDILGLPDYERIRIYFKDIPDWVDDKYIKNNNWDDTLKVWECQVKGKDIYREVFYYNYSKCEPDFEDDAFPYYVCSLEDLSILVYNDECAVSLIRCGREVSENEKDYNLNVRNYLYGQEVRDLGDGWVLEISLDEIPPEELKWLDELKQYCIDCNADIDVNSISEVLDFTEEYSTWVFYYYNNDDFNVKVENGSIYYNLCDMDNCWHSFSMNLDTLADCVEKGYITVYPVETPDGEEVDNLYSYDGDECYDYVEYYE